MKDGKPFFGKYPCRLRLRADESFLASLPRIEAALEEAGPGGFRTSPSIESYRSVLERRAQGKIVEVNPNGVMDMYFESPSFGRAMKIVAGCNCVDFRVNTGG